MGRSIGRMDEQGDRILLECESLHRETKNKKYSGRQMVAKKILV
jgi:hypothetical protein